MNKDKKSHSTTYIFLSILVFLVIVFLINWSSGSDSGWFIGVFALLGIIGTIIAWPIVVILDRAASKRIK